MRLEPLEDRQLLAVVLNWTGAGNALNLTEATSGATPSIVISEPIPNVNVLKIDLGTGKVFADGSTVAAVGLSYQNADSPTTSQYATIDIGTAGSVSGLVASLPGNTLTLGPIRDTVAGIGDITASAAVIVVAGVDTLNANGNVNLKATGNLTVNASAVLETGTGTVALAADTKPDGTGDDGVGILTIQGNSVVYGASISLRGADMNIVSTARVGTATSLCMASTVAGAAGQPGDTNGTGSMARFNYLCGVAVDSSGNMYVADTANQLIRKITPAGVVTTLAGLSGVSGSADGTGSAARFNGPQGVTVDGSGNVYVADTSNQLIRKITPAGVVSTLAGSAYQKGYADGTGTAARFNNPYGVAVDGSGNLYIADGDNHEIRKITPAGVVSTFAGAALQAGDTDGISGAARFYNPQGVAVDNSGNVYVGDSGNQLIRKITSAGVVTTLAGASGQIGWANGAGTAARFDSPRGVTVDSAGNVYVADYWNCEIRKITPAGVVTTWAGSPEDQGSTDGFGSAARFNLPQGVGVDSAGNVYVADTYNCEIRKLTAVPLTDDVTIRSSVSARPMSLGGTDSAVAGVNLTDTELSRIQTSANGTVTIGNNAQTGNVIFTTAAPATTAGAATVVVQDSGSGGQIVLDDAGTGTGLNGNGGTVTLASGTGGVVARAWSAGSPLSSLGFNAAGLTLTPTLNFAPSPDTSLMVINNTAASTPIAGAFSNLAQGGVISASYGGNTYNFRADYSGGDGNDLVLRTVALPPEITSIVVGDGSAQRSLVRSLTVTFNMEVVLDSGAFEIVRSTAMGGGAVTVGVNTSVVNGYTQAILTFSGGMTEYGSLKDGNYQLSVRSAKVRDTVFALALDGDGNNQAGGDCLFGTQQADKFFRLFGDSDGDRDVDNLDYARMKGSYLKSVGQVGCLDYFNFNGDSIVNDTDLAQFRIRYLTKLAY